MTQPGLNFTSGVPYQRGSHTSFKAAQRLASQGTRGQKVRLLLRQYVAGGDQGFTDGELHARTGYLRSSLCSLRAALSEPGLIEKAGERLGSYGVAQTVWRATEAGRRVVASWTDRG